VAVGIVLALAAALLPAVPAHAVNSSTVVSLTFDDGDADQMPAAATLKSKGLKGTFFIADSWIGASGYMTRANLNQLAADGNEIGGHTVTHPDLATTDPTEAKRQICDNRAMLQSWGFKPTSFAYPFASADPNVEALVQACGFNTGRGLGDVRSPGSCAGCAYAETMPPVDPYYLQAPDQVDSTWTLAQLKAIVTNAVTHGGGWVVLTFHHVCAPIGTANCQADQSITPTTYNAFVSWLASYVAVPTNQTTVKTLDGAVRQYKGSAYPAYVPAFTVPAPAPAPVGVNALTNPSLESLNTVTGFPTCYQAGGWGANTPTWARTSPGATGTYAETLTVAGYSSGDAKLLPTLDLGQCSPSVVAGKTYQISVTAKSTAITQFALYYRDANNMWFYWTSSPWIAPLPAWTVTTFVTPPVPTGAVAVTFGLALIQNGTLATDDYSFVDPGAATVVAAAGTVLARSATNKVASANVTVATSPKNAKTVTKALTRGQQVVVAPTSNKKQG
jgi:peptidoglycan/xylan/chitin deacetylase (PgdA/CDA1 family)